MKLYTHVYPGCYDSEEESPGLTPYKPFLFKMNTGSGFYKSLRLLL